jgi:broad specificity phosphatase PhoE
VTTFYLIRHAERTGDQELLAGRGAGFHLSTTGRSQAERLAQHLARESITHVFSSPLERTRETAEPIARHHRLVVEISPALGEIDAGNWTGRTFRELDASDAEWRKFNQFRGGTRIPGGESMVEVQSRFVGEMLRLRDTYPDEGIVLVSHADPIKVAIACFIGAPLDFYDRFEIGLGSVSILRLTEWSAKLVSLNDTPSTVSS